MFRGAKVCLAALVAMLLGLAVVRAQPQGPAREIIPLSGDLYRARNGNWYTIFLVTPDGIILGDPINRRVRRLAERRARPSVHRAGAVRRLQPQPF